MRFVTLTLVVLSTASYAADAGPDAVSAAQVESWTKTWQERLSLLDWRIETRVVRTADLRADTLGNLKWNSLTRLATIKVLSPLDYNATPAEIAEDMEYTVVHELVHLQLAALPRDPNNRDLEEAVVNKIADALMTLDKGPAFRARSIPPGKTAPVNSAKLESKTPEVARDSGK